MMYAEAQAKAQGAAAAAAAAAAGGGGEAKKDEKVVDAEYTEVNDKK